MKIKVTTKSIQTVAERCYQQGRADAIDDILFILYDKGYINSDDEDYVRRKLKEQNK